MSSRPTTRELDRVRREQRIPRSLSFAELVDVYLAQHDVQPVTIEKLRWLLAKAIAAFGERRIGSSRRRKSPNAATSACYSSFDHVALRVHREGREPRERLLER